MTPELNWPIWVAIILTMPFWLPLILGILAVSVALVIMLAAALFMVVYETFHKPKSDYDS